MLQKLKIMACENKIAPAIVVLRMVFIVNV